MIAGAFGSAAMGGAGEEVPVGEDHRYLTLEVENVRLTRLVAELLMKNQQLRAELNGAGA